MYIMRYGCLKIMLSNRFCIMEDNLVIPTDDMMLRLSGVTTTFAHGTIRIMNMCH